MATDRCDLLCLDLPRAEEIRHGLELDRIAAAAARAGALADPTRLTIAAALSSGGELCVCDLAWITARAENLVGHHLRSLRDAGLAVSRREGKMVFYSLTSAGLALLEAHLSNVTRAVYVREVADARRRSMRRSRIVAEFGGALRIALNPSDEAG